MDTFFNWKKVETFFKLFLNTSIFDKKKKRKKLLKMPKSLTNAISFEIKYWTLNMSQRFEIECY